MSTGSAGPVADRPNPTPSGEDAEVTLVQQAGHVFPMRHPVQFDAQAHVQELDADGGAVNREVNVDAVRELVRAIDIAALEVHVHGVRRLVVCQIHGAPVLMMVTMMHLSADTGCTTTLMRRPPMQPHAIQRPRYPGSRSVDPRTIDSTSAGSTPRSLARCSPCPPPQVSVHVLKSGIIVPLGDGLER